MTCSATSILISDFLRRFPVKSVEAFENLTLANQHRVFRDLAPEQQSTLLSTLIPTTSAKLLTDVEELATVANLMDPSKLARIIAWLEPSERSSLLNRLPELLRKEIDALQQYPVDSAGFLMETKVSLFHSKDTVAQAMQKMKEFRGRNSGSLFLIDFDGKLEGRVYLQDMIAAEPHQHLGDLARVTPYVNEMAPKDEIIEVVEKNQLPSIPVLDAQQGFLGAIYHDSLVQFAHEDAFDGLQTMVGVSRDEKALSPAPFAVRKRLPWLTVNLLTTFVAAFVVGLFEETIAKITALAVLLPVVAGQSGNTGAQSQAVTMRGLALREIRLRHKWRVLLKEGSVGATNGLLIGLMCSASVFFWSQSVGLAVVIGVAMIIAMFAASLSGAAIPMILTAVGQDPATSSSIILTTITDIVGFLSFLGLATLFGQYLI